MALRARLTAPPPQPKTVWPWHEAKWASVAASTMMVGDRRFEADSYLATAFGIRTAIEGRATGWSRLGTLARVWQPSRLKGIQVSRDFGTPFLAATQVFDLRPTPRKWLSLDRTGDAENRFVKAGQILVTCSGNVGRATLAYRPHEAMFISHDLLRLEPHKSIHWGWVYAFLRSPKCRAIMTAAQYGHVIKHLEVSHLEALPILTVDDGVLADFNADAETILKKRNASVDLILEAEAIFDELLGVFSAKQDEAGFSVHASLFTSGRRRLEASYHHPQAAAIVKRFKKLNLKTEPLEDVAERIWWLARFKRVFGDEGMPYMSSDELFSLNPTIIKRVLTEQADNAEDYLVKAGWIVMACSGQTYGLNGSVSLADKQYENYFFSHDIVRIIPKTDRIRPGYLYAALGHPRFGRPLVIRHAYGTSIPHLDPGDIASIPIVRLEASVENEVANRMEKAVQLRGEADELENAIAEKAERFIDEFLHSPEARPVLGNVAK
jgi:type I restriction enzyme, S subunit